jgi:succinate dehydrogenase/fumarate reductase flavoprotein subunit
MGVETRPPVTLLRYGRGHQFDANQYLDNCLKHFREHGGRLLNGTETASLLIDDGIVVGARCELPDGSIEEIRARWTLLATGGFQGDPELRAELIHENARGIELRSNPHSDGVGRRLAQQAGASIGKPGAGFYGHLMPAGVALRDPSMFVELGLYYSEHALLFNIEGERFVDETVGDHLTTNTLVAQPEARGLLVADATVYDKWINASYVEGLPASDRFAACARRGARCAVANSLDEFLDVPEEWGYPGERIRDGIVAYNAAVRDGSVTPTRRYDPNPIEKPPFYVLEAAPAITFTMTGALIDEHARVRAEGGGLVPGLLAAGADAGGLYSMAYAGGLAPALVFGRQAARTAMSMG